MGADVVVPAPQKDRPEGTLGSGMVVPAPVVKSMLISTPLALKPYAVPAQNPKPQS